MSLINFFKKMFSKNKQDRIEKKEIIDEMDNIDKNNLKDQINIPNYNLSLNNEKILKNNYTNNKYLQEQEKLLQLKYLNKKNNIIPNTIQTANVESISINKLNTIWDIIKIRENTQAEHIIRSIPSDKWVTMDEIRHEIKLNFNVEYVNEKSLYPYLKTLTDINLIKLNNTGKKRTWKKNIIFIKEE